MAIDFKEDVVAPAGGIDFQEELAPESSVMDAIGTGLAQGATMGFSDELGGLKDSLLNGEDYTQSRDRRRAENAKIQEDSPWITGAAEVAGSLPLMLVPGLNAAKGASMAAKVGAGALAGGAFGLGKSEADLTKGEVAGAAIDAATGAALGGATTYGISKAVSGAERLKSYLADKAGRSSNILTVKSLKPSAKQLSSLGEQGIQDLGEHAKQQGVVTFGSNAAEALPRATALKNRGGDIMGQALNAVDDVGINTEVLAGQANEAVLKPFATTNLRGPVSAVGNVIEDLGSKGPLTPGELNQFGASVGKIGYNDASGSAGKQGLRQVERFVDTAIKDTMDAPTALQFQKGNTLFGAGTNLEKFAKAGASRYAANQGISLGDKLAAGMGGGFLGPKGLLLGVGNKLVRERGQSAAAVGMDKLSKILKASPQLFGKYTQQLQAASQRGTLPVVHYLLQQKDPAYREMVQQMQSNQ